MRTTVTLDPDVQRLLKDTAHRKGQPFKQVLNDAVRAGLRSTAPAGMPFKQPVFSLGRAKVDLTQAGALAAELEDQDTIAAPQAQPPMRTPDVNVLLYAVNQDSPQHTVAREWIEASLARGAGVGFAWPALLGFLRLATRAGIFSRPLPIEAALGVVDAWLHHSTARTLLPTEKHASVLSRLLLGAGQGGNLVSDAHLATLAIEHNAELVTFDRDFARFAGLRWTLLK